jgi:hypothetical protein
MPRKQPIKKVYAHEFLEAGAGHLKDRAEIYDKDGDYDGERSMGRTVAMFNALYGTNLSEEQGWQFMSILKMVRSIQGGYKADNYEDQAAYAALAGETAARTRR